MLNQMTEATARRYPSCTSAAEASINGSRWVPPLRGSRRVALFQGGDELVRGVRKTSESKGPFIQKVELMAAPPKHCRVGRSACVGTSCLHIWMQQRFPLQGGGEAEDRAVHAPPRARARGPGSVGVCVHARARTVAGCSCGSRTRYRGWEHRRG